MSIPTPAEIKATQTCGENGQIDRYCKLGPSSWSCGLCDATDPENKHPVSFLNDMVDENHTTCWHSGRILDPSIKPTDQKLDLETVNPKNVSIEINFKHLYEINFIWIEFCGPIPDAMAIYKSVRPKTLNHTHFFNFILNFCFRKVEKCITVLFTSFILFCSSTSYFS